MAVQAARRDFRHLRPLTGAVIFYGHLVWACVNVLVTGGGGFLGSHVVERLPAAGHDPFVAAARRLRPDARRTTPRGCSPTRGPSSSFHLAAEVGGIGANRANPGRYWYANLMMGAHVLEQSRSPASRSSSRRHGLRLPEVHAGAVPRGRPLERLPRGDERAVRRREEGAARRRAGLPRAVRAATPSTSCPRTSTARATTSTSRPRT